MLRRYSDLIAGKAPTGNYTELNGSPKIVCDERGVTGTRTFLVHGDKLARFLAAMRGSPAREDAPEALPGFPRILCVSADAEPFQGSRGLPSQFAGGVPINPGQMTSEWWKVTCRFEVPSGIAYEFAGEALTLPTAGIGWSGDPTPVDGMGIVTTVPCGEVQINRKNQPQMIPAKIMQRIGQINNADFSPLTVDQNWRARVGYGATQIYTDSELRDSTIAAGCALFLGASSNPVTDPLGYISWDVVFKFSIRPPHAPWNFFFRPSLAVGGRPAGGAWERLVIKTVDTGGNVTEAPFEPYTETAFYEIFT